MELELKSINVCNYDKKSNTVCTVESDIIVPDTKPDIYRILCVNAKADLEEQYVRKGKMVLSGNVRFDIMYIGETDKGRIYTITTTVPFNHQHDVAGSEDSYQCISGCRVASTDFKVKNSRKLSAAARLSMDTEVIDYSTLDILESVSGDNPPPSKQTELSYDTLAGCRSVSFTVSDTISLPGIDISEVPDLCVYMDNTEIKTVNNKAIIKGILPAKLFYISSGEPTTYETEISFTEIADMDMANSDSVLCSNFSVSGVDYQISQTEDDTTVDLDIKVSGYIKAYDRINHSVVSDIYSPDYSYTASKNTLKFEKISGPADVQITLKDTLSSDFGNISRVYYMNVYPFCQNITCDGSSVRLSGSVQTCVIYSNEDGELCSTKKDIPYEINTPVDCPGEDTVFDYSVCAANYGYTLGASGDAQARIILKSSVCVRSVSQVTVISDFAEDKASPIDKSAQPGIIVCYPDGSKTMWDYAVKYNTTCQDIAAVNNLDTHTPLVPGEPILIPKRVCRS